MSVDMTKKIAACFDIDGTLSNNVHRAGLLPFNVVGQNEYNELDHVTKDRLWKNWEKELYNDEVIEPIKNLLHALKKHGYHIVINTSRGERCRDETLRWLKDKIDIVPDHLVMRDHRDFRPTAIVKCEKMQELERAGYTIAMHLDDDESVIEQLRFYGYVVLGV